MYEQVIRPYFYPEQIRQYLRLYAENLPTGQPAAYDVGHSSRYSIVRPRRFRFSYELWSGDGLPLNFNITMRHVFTGPSPSFYARARTELMRNSEHPMFEFIDGWDPLRRFGLQRDKRAPLQMPLPVHTVDSMAKFVWQKLPFHSVYSRRHAFSLIMTALEGRLTLEKLVERAKNGTLPKKWRPVTFELRKVDLAIDRLLDRERLSVPSARAKSRFQQAQNIRFCVPIYTKFCGTFVSVAHGRAELIEDLPAYFVAQKGKSWQVLFSDAREPKSEPVATGKGNPEECQARIIEVINQHLISALLNATDEPSLMLKISREHFYKVNLVPLQPSDCVKCYTDMLAYYTQKLHKVFASPEQYTDKEGDEVKTELEVMVYRVMQEAIDEFFPTPDKGLESNKQWRLPLNERGETKC